MTTPLRIEITDDARAQIATAAAWWAGNRISAPGAILQDLDRILGLLSAQPGMGTRARRLKLSGVRRVTLAAWTHVDVAWAGPLRLSERCAGVLAWRSSRVPTGRLHQALPAGSTSVTAIEGKQWLRNVAANPNADPAALAEQVLAAVEKLRGDHAKP